MNTALPGRFKRLWAASAVSNIGDGVREVALPLLATELTSDPRLIAGVAIAERIPWMVMILPGGVATDRYDRRNLRVRLDIGRAIVMGALAVLVATDNASMIAIFVVAALLAGGESVVEGSTMALVPSLVSRPQYERAGGLLTSTELVGNGLIGPPIGGLLFALATVLPFAFDAVSFAVAAAIAASIAGRFRPTPTPTAGSSRSFRRELVEGFRWLWRQPLLRNLALVSTLLGFSGFMHSAVFVLFARDVLGLGPVGFGLILVPPAIGGVVGSLLANRLRHRPLGPTLTAAVAIGGIAVFAIALTDIPVVVALLSAIDSAAVLLWNVRTIALRQRIIPNHLLGRVGASYRFFVYAAMPLGALAGGIVADQFSIESAFLIAGALQIGTAVLIPFATRPAADMAGTAATESADESSGL